jgi:hypothetical protein
MSPRNLREAEALDTKPKESSNRRYLTLNLLAWNP